MAALTSIHLSEAEWLVVEAIAERLTEEQGYAAGWKLRGFSDAIQGRPLNVPKYYDAPYTRGHECGRVFLEEG